MAQTQEYVVRVPRDCKKRFHVMRFNKALNTNISDWNKSTCKMERENNAKENKNEPEAPMYGAGSEFGKQQREEARRKKYGAHSKKYDPNGQPWMLKVGSGKNAKRFKGIREGGVNENASYYVFFQAVDGVFEAFPVDEWYNFTTVNRYKALTSEEAEEKFAERNKIFNFFPVMSNKRNDENEGSNNKKVKNSMKITDLDEWGCSDDSRSEDEVDDVDVKPKIKKGKKEVKKKKKGAADSSESEAHEESDEGDFDDKELEYISDSSDESESESDNEKTAPKGVEDEDGIRKVILSDDEDEEEDEKNKNGDETDKNDDKNSLKDDSVKIKSEKDSNDSPPPSSSDSDDSDVDDSKSALFMQRPPQKLALNKSKNGSEQSTSRSTTPTLNELQGSPGTSKTDTGKLKRKNSTSDLTNAAKKSKLSQDLNTDGISEEAVRKYLIRKPMTTKDLLQKFRKQVSTKDELLHSIAEILKRLNPQKEMIKGKLYLSLKE